MSSVFNELAEVVLTMIEGFIFDVDGVLVDSPHERAWGDTLDELIRTHWPELVEVTGYAAEKYTTAVYQEHVAGKPRKSGAAALLAYFTIDDPDEARVRLLCDRKQEMIVRLIEEGKFKAYDDALGFLLKAKAAGASIAAASSSKNANMLMAKVDLYAFCERSRPRFDFVADGTTLLDVFDANVCGRDLNQGKPHPEIFLNAAQALKLQPAKCVVIEDAPSGVQAAKAGEMACIGVARLNDEVLLREADADWVVTSLDAMDPLDLMR